MYTVQPDAAHAREPDREVCVCSEQVAVASSPSPSERDTTGKDGRRPAVCPELAAISVVLGVWAFAGAALWSRAVTAGKKLHHDCHAGKSGHILGVARVLRRLLM